jgi:hypothetical protein
LPTFQRFLDAIIGSSDNPALITREMMQGLTEHCAHIVRESRWDGRSEEIREEEAQLETLKRPAQRAAMRDRLAAIWGVPVSELPMDQPPPVAPQARYREVLSSGDPLDAVYWDLREFLLRDQGDRLRKCPVCKRYFVQVTARVRTYCDTPCRLTASPTRRARNAEYQQQYQERRIRDDLQKVRRAKDELWKTGVAALKLSWVLETAGISSRRWTSLRQWEIGQYEKPQVTDLTRRERPLARSG